MAFSTTWSNPISAGLEIQLAIPSIATLPTRNHSREHTFIGALWAIPALIALLAIPAFADSQATEDPFVAPKIRRHDPPSYRDSFTFSAGAVYDSGEFGGSRLTESSLLTLGVKYRTRNWSLGLVAPYLDVSGPSRTIPGVGSIGTGSTSNYQRSGMGDLSLKGKLYVWNNVQSGTTVNLGGRIKFGTASRSELLGTGENDYMAEVGVTQRLSSSVTGLVSAGYRLNGSSATLQREDVLYGNIGVDVRVNPRLHLGTSMYLAEGSTVTGEDRHELNAYANYALSNDWTVTGFVLNSFSGTGLLSGGGITINRKFDF